MYDVILSHVIDQVDDMKRDIYIRELLYLPHMASTRSMTCRWRHVYL